MNERLNAFQTHTALFRCPLCGTALKGADTSLKCENGHDFALSRRGYCDFAPQKHLTLYSGDLFESRRRILTSRLYDAARKELIRMTNAYAPDAPVLDAGCGEGTFLKAVCEGRLCYGADLARDGIRMAASGGNGLGWMVADLARLPFQDGAIGCILNILSPAAYPEFMRVLLDDGILIKVIPGDEYLKELRALAGKEPHSEVAVKDLFISKVQLLEETEIKETFFLNEEEASDLCRMTPLTEHAQAVRLPEKITVNLVFLAGKKK